MSILAEITFSIRNIVNEHLVIFLVGYSVVFFCLAFLWAVFYLLPKLLHLRFKELARPKAAHPGEKAEEAADNNFTGEEAAAISMALYLYINDLHDEENRVLTIRKISRRYSPWSSKIYGVTNGLNKRF